MFSKPVPPGFSSVNEIVPALPHTSNGPLKLAVAIGSEAPLGDTITVAVREVVLHTSSLQPNEATYTGLKILAEGQKSA